MLVVYSDESGVGGNLKREPVTVVAAVAINMDRQWNDVESALFAARFGTPAKLLHRLALKGKNLYSALRTNIPEAADAARVLEEVLAIPAGHKLPIFYGAIDRIGFGKSGLRTTEYDAAFSECLERVERAIKPFAENGRVLWIAHRSEDAREQRTKTQLFWHRVHEEIQIEGEPLKVIRKEPSVSLDTVYFGNDQTSTALQLADVCCSTITERLKEKYYGRNPAYAVPFYEQIRLSVKNDGTPPSFRSK